MATLTVPPGALVLLIGPAGSGKSTFAARRFKPGEVLSSDAFRASVSGDPADQSANPEAFRRLHAAANRKLAAGEITVVDATNVQGFARRRLLTVAARHRRPVVALVFAVPLAVALAQNASRPGRSVPEAVVREQDSWLRQSLPGLAAEGFDRILVLERPEEIGALRVRRSRRIPDTKKRPEGTAPDPLMQSPESSPGP